jgi:hypothetical protein
VIIDELLRSPARRSLGAVPEADALTEVGALQEAGLVDVRTDAIGGRVEMLFDLRSALQFRLADTAVLVITGVRHFELDRTTAAAMSRGTPYVMSSVPSIDGDWLDFEAVCLGGWSIHIRGRGAEFFVGNVLELPDAPPNFSEDDDEAIRRGMQSWQSDLDADWATFIDPAELHPSS